jgi:S1-C subfamily serine protease
MIPSPRFDTPRLFLVTVAGLILGGCAVSPIDVSRREFDGESALNLPIDARAEMLLPLGDADRKIVVDDGFPILTLDDGEAITKAAGEVFAKVFKKVGVRGEVENPQFVLKIKGEAEVHRIWATYRVEVVVRLETGSDEKVGTYQAEGKARSGIVNDQVALENAYREAFLNAASLILEDHRFVELVWYGMPEGLERITESVPDRRKPQYEAIMRSVVTVRVMSPVAKPGTSGPLVMEKSHGSGFFVDDNGLILTNHHVIGDSTDISVICDETEYPAQVLASDEWADLALLQIENMESPYLEVAEERDAAAVGEEVVVVGSPLKSELDYSVSRGIVSSYRMMGGYSFLQTDAAINEGSSGGPVVNLRTGEVVGVVAMRYFGQGLGFALTSDVVTEFLRRNGVWADE